MVGNGRDERASGTDKGEHGARGVRSARRFQVQSPPFADPSAMLSEPRQGGSGWREGEIGLNWERRTRGRSERGSGNTAVRMSAQCHPGPSRTRPFSALSSPEARTRQAAGRDEQWMRKPFFFLLNPWCPRQAQGAATARGDRAGDTSAT